MAYHFNQIVYDDSKNYTQEINWFKTTKETYDALYGRKFNDTCIQVGTIGNFQNFSLDETYYLRFFAKMKDYEQVGTIYIKSSEEESTEKDKDLHNQIIENSKVFTIKEAPDEQHEYWVEFNITFKSIKARDQIVFVLTRGPAQAQGAGAKERFDLKDISLRTITNVMPQGISAFKQIGIQGYPGLKFCIDGELIRIGKSGIYEVNNGYVISFLGFIYNEEDLNKPFILDYQY